MALPSWAPSVDQIGSLLYARTRDEYGNLTGTFTTDSSPTALQVLDLVESVTDDIAASIGAIPVALEGAALQTARFAAAALVELSFFPNQVGDDPDIYDKLVAERDRRWAALLAAVQDYTSNPEGDPGDGDDVALPANGFPGLVGTTLTEEF